MEIDLRKEIHDLIETRGHWIVLRQSYPGRMCPCVNPATGDATKNCNTCFGSGRAFVDRFVKGRKAARMGFRQGGASESRSPIGVASAPDGVFYIEYHEKPSQSDFVLEIALDNEYQEPLLEFKVMSVYDVNEAVEYRDQKGRIEYCALFGNRLPWHPFKATEIYNPPKFPDSML